MRKRKTRSVQVRGRLAKTGRRQEPTLSACAAAKSLIHLSRFGVAPNSWEQSGLSPRTGSDRGLRTGLKRVSAAQRPLLELIWLAVPRTAHRRLEAEVPQSALVVGFRPSGSAEAA